MLEHRLVRGRELTQRRQNSLGHLVGGRFADSKHGRVLVHFARQPVRIDRERDRHRGHRAREAFVDSRKSREQVHAPQMHPDAQCVGVIDQPIRGRIANFVLKRGAKVSTDRIAAVTVDENAELGVGLISCRSRMRREAEQKQGENSD